MPSFCTNCGSPIAGPFCGSCGRRAQTPSASTPNVPQPPAPMPPPPVVPAPSAAQKSSGAGKPILIGCAIVFVLLAAGTAASIYGVYWFKNKAMAKVSTYTGGMAGSPSETKVAHGNTCSLLSRDELQQVLGV